MLFLLGLVSFAISLFFKLACFNCVSGVGVEAGVGVEVGVEVELLLVVLSGTQDFMIGTETEPVFQLNCAEILLLADAGEVVVVHFFMQKIKIWMTAGIVGTRRGADP